MVVVVCVVDDSRAGGNSVAVSSIGSIRGEPLIQFVKEGTVHKSMVFGKGLGSLLEGGTVIGACILGPVPSDV